MPETWQPRSDRPQTVAPILHVRVDAEIERLQREETWRTGDRNAITLTKERTLRVVLTVLKAGAKLHEHQAAGALTLQVIRGRLAFRAAGQALELGPGEVIVLGAAVEHEVEALAESAFLLTLVGSA